MVYCTSGSDDGTARVWRLRVDDGDDEQEGGGADATMASGTGMSMGTSMGMSSSMASPGGLATDEAAEEDDEMFPLVLDHENGAVLAVALSVARPSAEALSRASTPAAWLNKNKSKKKRSSKGEAGEAGGMEEGGGAGGGLGADSKRGGGGDGDSKDDLEGLLSSDEEEEEEEEEEQEIDIGNCLVRNQHAMLCFLPHHIEPQLVAAGADSSTNTNAFTNTNTNNTTPPQLATAGADSSIKLWDLTGHGNGESSFECTLNGHTSSVTSLAFGAAPPRPEPRRSKRLPPEPVIDHLLYSGSYDRTLRVSQSERAGGARVRVCM